VRDTIYRGSQLIIGTAVRISFLAKRCNCIASSPIYIKCCLSSVCLSSVFRLSVTRVYCDKTTEVRIMQFSLKCSPTVKEEIAHVLPSSITKLEEDPLDRGLTQGWGGFRSSSRRYISKTLRDRA